MRKAHIFAYEFLNIDNELYSNSNEFPNHVYFLQNHALFAQNQSDRTD